jgi:carbon storage regulator CsrA
VLVLTRKTQQQIQIGDKITITILRVKGNSVRVGIDAPRDERIIRSELHDRPIPAPKVEVATEAKTVQAPRRPIGGESGCDGRGGIADETVRPLANRVRVLTSQAVRYPERLGVSSLRCALGRR